MVSALVMITWFSDARSKGTAMLVPFVSAQDTVPPDTLADTTRTEPVEPVERLPYSPSRRSTFQPVDRYGDPFSSPMSPSPLLLENPSVIQTQVEIDSTMEYTVYERIGDIDYRPPTTLTFEEFTALQNRKMMREYWKTRSRGLDGESPVSGRGLIPPIYISPIFDKIFGGSYVDIQPTGFVTLDFGGRWQRVDNPSIPVRQQRNGGFEFDQQISMNVIGEIGDKLRITANFDNNNSFDFENDLRVEYTGYEEDIIQKIEIGNVSMPVNNSLIGGSQNLFGIKTQLRFGRLFVTGLASTQRGSTDMLEIEGGGQVRKFDIRASEYDDNRHFFLGHFFRDNYGTGEGQWLSNLPQISSGVSITRLEVYVINRNNDTETQRNFVAFTDLGEGRVLNNTAIPSQGNVPTANNANSLFAFLQNINRNVDGINEALAPFPYGDLRNGVDYEKVNNARKLQQGEYSFDSQLGYISLFRKLQSDEALAVAYEYTYRGQRYKVGELSEDVQNIGESQAIFLKLLRPAQVNVSLPTWDLMMKNIYNLNANQVTREGFQMRVVYRDDVTGMDNSVFQEGPENVKDNQIVQLIGADRLNQNGDRPADGNFDFVEGITINPENGFLIFPDTEPFGEKIRNLFPDNPDLQRKYVFDTLYSTTKADAEQVASNNKYWLSGQFLSGSANEIMLPGINIAEGSVVVMAGNTPLTEGVDYEVDYNLGKVTIINQGVQGESIRINYEKADLFSFQTRSLLGTRLDYRVSDDINIGATLLYLNERPPNTNYRATIGQESMRNTKWGIDINYRKDSRFLTKLVDALPLIQTKEISTITFNGEFAQLIPGTSNRINGEGTSYIDDFESTVTPFNLGGNPQNWKLASTPAGVNLGAEDPGLAPNFKRGRLAWYVIDNVFYRDRGRGVPSSITSEDLKNHYVRPVKPKEVFPGRDEDQLDNYLPIFDLAYYPAERGQYNYRPDNLNPDGTFRNPAENWGGITRAITSDVDFDKTNIEYIEFWMMDPFIKNSQYSDIEGIPGEQRTGGKLVFNLGNVSEDVLPDEIHAFENGLPANGSAAGNVKTSPWGRMPLAPAAITKAFDNDAGSRQNQDVGLDGLKGEEEFSFFFNADNPAPMGLNAEAMARLRADASSDDFMYFLGPQHDQANASILERYKRYNNMENNSPVIGGSNLEYTPVYSSTPDNEDVNNDNTISTLEAYYEYTVDLNPNSLKVGEGYVVDKITNTDNRAGEPVDWYLFRIPIRKPERTLPEEGSITGFKTIRFLRTYLTGFEQPVVLRMAKFQLVGSQWRRYTESLRSEDDVANPVANDNPFTISVVNIEENGQGGEGATPYVLPPGIEREQDNTTQYRRRINEQSLQLCVEDLPHMEGNAVYKNLSIDMVNYGRLKMFLHAEAPNLDVQDDEVAAFIRLGTDFTNNYYEIELPLKMTPPGTSDRRGVWPLENEIDLPLDELLTLKSARNRNNGDAQIAYSRIYEQPDAGRKYKLTIKGRPELSSVQIVMIGVRNLDNGTDTRPKTFCIWANELRVADFDRSTGWAANARVNAKLADFANITSSVRYTSFGFGGIQQKISERTREEIREFDIAASVTLDKLLPEKAGLQIPMYVSYRTTKITPEYDPLDPDIPLKASLAAIDNPQERDSYEQMVQDNTVRRSINFTNIRKVKTNENAKNRIYDIENLSFSYAYNDINQSDFRTASYEYKSYRGSVAYNFAPNAVSVAPFQNVGFFSSPYLTLFRDFNFSPVPTNLAFRADVVRTFAKTQLRNANLGIAGIDPTFEKSFIFNRFYDLRWNLTRGLSFDYNARANAIVDEPFGDLDTDTKKNEVWDNLMSFGRMKSFDQSVAFNYRVPLDKLPFTDWISSDVRYVAGYNWNSGSYNPYLEDSVQSLKELYGNTIQNTREQSISGNVDMMRLYNKVKVLNRINNPPRRGRATEADTVRSITDNKFVTGFLKVLMSLKSVNLTYSVREGTLLPGFAKDVFLLGLDSSFNAPGIPFLLGSQDPSIRHRAAEGGWLVGTENLTTSFSQTKSIDFNIRANLEPVKDLRIQLDMRKMNTMGYRENFELGQGGTYESINPSRFGSYSISFIGIRTAFKRNYGENISPVFEAFDENRRTIRRRLEMINPSGLAYSENNQDVLIPAFIAAYSGKDVNEVDLNPFPQIPIPNWRVDYAGLSKIPALSEVFSSINLTHSYNATYSINNYISAGIVTDSEDLVLDNDIKRLRLSRPNEDDVLVPFYSIGQVVFTERFAPLIGVNLRTRSRLNFRVEYRKERNVSLNLSNAQVAELNSNDVLVDFGFTKANIRLPFRTKGRTTVLNNDLTFRMGLTIRDTETIQRRLSSLQVADSSNANNVVTSGNVNFQLRPTIDYVLNQRLNLQIYFERTINEPKISSSFRRSTTSFGTKLTFNLAQ